MYVRCFWICLNASLLPDTEALEDLDQDVLGVRAPGELLEGLSRPAQIGDQELLGHLAAGAGNRCAGVAM